MCQDLISDIVAKVSNDIIWCFFYYYYYFLFIYNADSFTVYLEARVKEKFSISYVKCVRFGTILTAGQSVKLHWLPGSKIDAL